MDDPLPPALAGTTVAPPRRSPLGLILRLAVTVACLALLLRIVHPRELIATLQRASWPFFLASLLANVCDESMATLKWRQLLRGVADPPPFLSMLRLTLEGRFIAFFLPSTVTADLYKGTVLTRSGRSGAAAFSSIVMERILGLLSIMTVGLVALGVLPAHLFGVNSAVTVVVAVGATAVGLAVFLNADRIAAVVLPMLPPRWQRLHTFLTGLAGAFAAYRGRAGLLVQAFLLSLLIQTTRAVAIWILARGVGDTTPFIYFVLLVPYVYLVNMLPIASSRVGLEQAVFVGLFSAVGMPPQTALAVSLLSVAVGFALVLPFGILLPFKR